MSHCPRCKKPTAKDGEHCDLCRLVLAGGIVYVWLNRTGQPTAYSRYPVSDDPLCVPMTAAKLESMMHRLRGEE